MNATVRDGAVADYGSHANTYLSGTGRTDAAAQ